MFLADISRSLSGSDQLFERIFPYFECDFLTSPPLLISRGDPREYPLSEDREVETHLISRHDGMFYRRCLLIFHISEPRTAI